VPHSCGAYPNQVIPAYRKWLPLVFVLIYPGLTWARSPREVPFTTAFPVALQVYSDFLKGVPSEVIARRYGGVIADLPADSQSALEWLLELQAQRGAERLGAAPLETHDISNSCYRPDKRGWDLSVDPLSHRHEAISEIPSLMRRIRSSFYLLDEDSELLACERCQLNPTCREQEERWREQTGARSAYQPTRDLEALRSRCMAMADHLVFETDRGIYFGDYLFDFSRCRALHEPAVRLRFCPSTSPAFSLSGVEFHLHPSCLNSAQNKTEWELLRARHHRVAALAQSVLQSCPLTPIPNPPEGSSSQRWNALPASSRDEFVLLTCMRSEPMIGGRPQLTEGQRGLIQWDARLLEGVGPRGYVYTVEEVRRVEEGAFFWKSTREERVSHVVLTNQPEEIELNRATLEELNPFFRGATPEERRVSWALAQTLAEDALRNQRDRFQVHRSGRVPSESDARVLAAIWTLDCARRNQIVSDSAALVNLRAELPGVEQAYDVCRRQALPVLSDPQESAAFQAACSRILQAWAPERSSDLESENGAEEEGADE